MKLIAGSLVNKQYDEPDFIEVVSGRVDSDRDRVESEIKALCFEQPFAVLVTMS